MVTNQTIALKWAIQTMTVEITATKGAKISMLIALFLLVGWVSYIRMTKKESDPYQFTGKVVGYSQLYRTGYKGVIVEGEENALRIPLNEEYPTLGVHTFNVKDMWGIKHIIKVEDDGRNGGRSG